MTSRAHIDFNGQLGLNDLIDRDTFQKLDWKSFNVKSDEDEGKSSQEGKVTRVFCSKWNTYLEFG
jgi:hypothetical protein